MRFFLLATLAFSALLIIPIFGKPQFPPQEAPQLHETCKDNGDNCRNWALNGFCTNCFYTCDQRKEYCARTCGFCHSNYVCKNPTCAPAAANFKKLDDLIRL